MKPLSSLYSPLLPHDAAFKPASPRPTVGKKTKLLSRERFLIHITYLSKSAAAFCCYARDMRGKVLGTLAAVSIFDFVDQRREKGFCSAWLVIRFPFFGQVN